MASRLRTCSSCATRLSDEHNFTKPNDERALQLMDHAARDVMNEFKDIVLAFGESDEYRYSSACIGYRPLLI